MLWGLWKISTMLRDKHGHISKNRNSRLIFYLEKLNKKEEKNTMNKEKQIQIEAIQDNIKNLLEVLFELQKEV